MNVNQLINMVTNQVIRRVVKVVIDRGINFASRKSVKPPNPLPNQAVGQDVTTPAELAQAAQSRVMADKAAKTARMARRLGR